MACSSTVRLNIGGKKFCTSVETLTLREPQSMLSAMFSGRHTLCKDSDKSDSVRHLASKWFRMKRMLNDSDIIHSALSDPEVCQTAPKLDSTSLGYVFVDRDGKHFRLILNWLRDGVAHTLFELPRLELLELLQEAKYYLLIGLVDKINEVMKMKDEQMNLDLTRMDIIKYVRPLHVDRPHVKLRGTNLSGLDLSKLDLSSVDFSFTCLKNVDFSHALLHSANFTGADAENAIFHNAMLCKSVFTKANLRGAILTGAYLESADLSSCSICNADLRSAELQKANLYKVNLEGANMEEADLTEAKLNDSQLKGANLRRARLCRSILLNTCLEDANLEGANLFQAVRRPEDQKHW